MSHPSASHLSRKSALLAEIDPLMTERAARLRQQVSGHVLTREDSGYDQTRRGWGLAIDQHPALIVVPDDATDVATAVRFARDAGLSVAVQSTGHGVLYPGDDSLLIVTSRMASVHVDAETHTARVEAGATWQPVLDAATPHGLAPLLGSAPHVGVVGYVLGGGIGWLGRRYGFGCDSVRRIELVTADGELREASHAQHIDLFWALRGGGGNFGVVTALELDLYPVPTLYGGTLVYPEESIRDALRLYRDWIKTVPDEMTSALAMVRFPDREQVPEAFRGKTLALVTGPTQVAPPTAQRGCSPGSTGRRRSRTPSVRCPSPRSEPSPTIPWSRSRNTAPATCSTTSATRPST